MIVNPENFQAIILGQRNQKEYNLKINDQNIEVKTQVTLLGLEINKELKFENHISSIYKISCNQLNKENTSLFKS